MPEKMIIFTRTYDLVTWLLPLTEKFPRSQRFVITQRLQTAVLNFPDTAGICGQRLTPDMEVEIIRL